VKKEIFGDGTKLRRNFDELYGVGFFESSSEIVDFKAFCGELDWLRQQRNGILHRGGEYAAGGPVGEIRADGLVRLSDAYQTRIDTIASDMPGNAKRLISSCAAAWAKRLDDN